MNETEKIFAGLSVDDFIAQYKAILTAAQIATLKRQRSEGKLY